MFCIYKKNRPPVQVRKVPWFIFPEGGGVVLNLVLPLQCHTYITSSAH